MIQALVAILSQESFSFHLYWVVLIDILKQIIVRFSRHLVHILQAHGSFPYIIKFRLEDYHPHNLSAELIELVNDGFEYNAVATENGYNPKI